MTLTIALIYPELLGTYGDRGNALVMKHRAIKRDIDCTIITVSPGEALPSSADIYLLGGGEDNAQTLATDLLREQKTSLNSALEKSQFIAVCAGFQILGKHFPISGGKLHDGLDVIDVTTQAGSPRIIGEIILHSTIEGIDHLTGFENHGGRTILGSNVAPLGIVETGFGNGIDSNSTSHSGFVDGYFSDHVIGTYLHGPLFARNPDFADYVLARAMNIETSSLKKLEDDPALTLHLERMSAHVH